MILELFCFLLKKFGPWAVNTIEKNEFLFIKSLILQKEIVSTKEDETRLIKSGIIPLSCPGDDKAGRCSGGSAMINQLDSCCSLTLPLFSFQSIFLVMTPHLDPTHLLCFAKDLITTKTPQRLFPNNPSAPSKPMPTRNH
jgi:hypothetical protein